MNAYCLAPWIVEQKGTLLGSKLKAIRPSHLNFENIPADKLTYLIENQFIIKPQSLYNQEHILTESLKTKYFEPIQHWIWASDPSFVELAFLLKKHLALLGAPCWEVVSDRNIILHNLKNNSSVKPFVLRLSHHEPIEGNIIKNLYADLIDKVNIIWLGETTEGTHIGPIISSSNDLEKYLTATKTWYFSSQLIEAGFGHYWPLLIYTHLKSTSNKVAEAISKIMEAPIGTCFLIEENREVCLWTQLTYAKTSETRFFDTQLWSKGLIRNFHIKRFESIDAAYIAKCRTPCNQKDYLEGNSGKGMSVKNATYSVVGEAVERFSAWQSNHQLMKGNKRHEKNRRIIYNTDQFHPFGTKWSHYLSSSKETLPLCEVRDELNPEHVCLVPECLVPFPYEVSEPKYDVTSSTTGGLAVYSNYQQAVIKASLELFERDDFYPSFLFQKAGLIIDYSTLEPSSQGPFSNLISLLVNLEKNLINYWFVTYNTKSQIPIVHCFVCDQKNNFFARGSGSGFNLLEATMSALLEALQIRQQILKSIETQEKSDNTWRDPEIIRQLFSYIESLDSCLFQDHPLATVEFTPSLLFQEIKNVLNALQKPLLVADLPCPIEGWFAVRVLVPGLTIHQFPSDSDGGKKIINPIFKYSIPT